MFSLYFCRTGSDSDSIVFDHDDKTNDVDSKSPVEVSDSYYGVQLLLTPLKGMTARVGRDWGLGGT